MVKGGWNPTVSRGIKYWSPQKRAKALELYSSSLLVLQEWHKKFHGSIKARRQTPTAKEWKEAEKKHRDLVPFLVQLSSGSRPSELALDHVADVMETRSLEYLRTQLTKAKEEKQKGKR